MFESLVERLLNKILGEYIENFNSENLHIGIWSGQVVLKNIALKKDIVKRLNLPFIIKFSRLGCLKLNVPWKSLTSSKIQVMLEGLELVIAELPASKWQCKNTKIIEKRKKEIQDYCESVLSDFAKKAQKSKDSEDGYFSKLVVKIIDNLQVTIKDIHIRYEDQITNEYSFGLTLEELKVYTVNSKNEPQYIDRACPEYANEPLRKRLELYNIGIYWNQKSQFYNESNYSQKLSTTIAKRGQIKHHHNYIILMSSQAKLHQRDPGKQFLEPEIDLSINLDTLKLEITNNQLQQIINLAERLQKYNREVKKHNTKVLTRQERHQYREEFQKLFPAYYKDWGKTLPEKDSKRIDDILEIMETEQFVPDIKKYLQDQEMKRIVEERKQKNRGWFSKPKELTPKEMEEIENYLNDNFAQQVSVVKRPRDYYHIQLQFRLEKLQIVIVNTLSIIKQGIQADFDQLNIAFKLREGGYQLTLGLEDIGVKMLKQAGIDPIEYTEVIYKIVPIQSQFRESEYIKLDVVGNPLDKPHLNTDIKLITSELMVVFYPKIIQIATNFADLRLSQDNKEAAIEKYGQYKEKTVNAVSESIQKPVKQMIGADLCINSITIALPFNAEVPHQDCWGLSLGSLHFMADEETLKRKEVTPQMPIDVFNLQAKAFSFKHYKSVKQLEDLRIKNIKTIDTRQSVIDNLNYDISLELYSQSTQKIPKIKIKAVMPEVSVTLNQDLYKSIIKIGDCFGKPDAAQEARATLRITEKAQIKARASKIGIVFIKDGVTQAWKKYVAIMSDNYIYLYLTTKDENYYAYYYIKNATLQKIHEPNDKEKPYYFRIKNKLNEVVFGFEKPQLVDDWINKINNYIKRQEDATTKAVIVEAEKTQPKAKLPNSLVLLVEAKVQKIDLTVYTTNDTQKDKIYFQLAGLQTQVYIHEAKKIIALSLSKIELTDILKTYKDQDLRYFLKTEGAQGTNRLVKVSILQLDKDHPQFENIVSAIDVDFGQLTCNYKCETVKALMSFFIPQKEDQQELKSLKLESSVSELSSIEGSAGQEVFNLKLNLKIEQISVVLINEKAKIQLGRLGLSKFKLYNGISQKRMVLLGALKDLFFLDYSNYPNTIIQQQQTYKPFERYLMRANLEQDKNMLEFNIEMLKQPNQLGKKMLIDTKLNNLTVYYTQQPVLRLITYLNTQMLPSFESGPKQQKEEQIKDSKPEAAPMELKVDLLNISVFLQPNPSVQRQNREYIQLNIQRISVRNKSILRNYITDSQNLVLVQNYAVILEGMCIFVKFFDVKGHKHDYELTNKLIFTCSTDLIANPAYYAKQYKHKFNPGLRIQCAMTPFVMRINQRDYSFLMKCLNWAVTHDDGVESILYDMPHQPKQNEASKNLPQQKDPFYLKLTIDCLSLFIMSKGIPISFLILDDLKYKFKQSVVMEMDLQLESIYGTSVVYNKDYKYLTETGMFNAIGYWKEHPFQGKIRIIDDLFRLFDRRGQRKKKQNKRPFLKFIMKMSQKESYMSIDIDQIIVDIDIKMLMTLSTVAVADQKYIKGPKPVIAKKPEPVEVPPGDIPATGLRMIREEPNDESMEKQIEPTVPIKKMKMEATINKIQASISDRKKARFVVLQGEINFSMTNSGNRTASELREHFSKADGPLSHNQMLVTLKDLTIYGCRIKDGEYVNKRQILKPFKLFCELNSYYECKEGFLLETTDIKVITTKIMLFASLIDLLNMDIIMKDNLKDLAQMSSPQKNKGQKQEVKAQSKLQQIEKEAAQAIQQKMKLQGEIEPIQFQLVNDCNNNFMPVMRLMVQDIKPFIDKFLIKNHTMVALVISLHFFNPRSSQWEPIIEPFKTAIDYLVLDTLDGTNVKIIMQSNINKEDPNDTGALKINVSSQMLETLLGAKEVAQLEKKKLENEAMAILDFIMNVGKHQQDQDIQVSPIILENITNEIIHIVRKQDEFQLNPLFRGPVKFEESQEIIFKLRGTTYRFGMDHYGTLRIGETGYFIQFDVDKLSRVIRIIPTQMIQNKLYKPLLIRRIGNVPNVPRKFQVGQFIPLDSIESFSISISGSSYTKEVLVSDVNNITSLVESSSGKFNLIWNKKIATDKYQVYEVMPPLIVHNCIPKDLEIQFLVKASTKKSKTIPAQASHEVCAGEKISTLEFRLNILGYSWSKLLRYKADRDGLQQYFVLEDADRATAHLNYVFQKDKTTEQYTLTVYCRKLIINQLRDKLIVYGNFAADELQKKRDRYQMLGGQLKHKQDFDDKVVLIGQEVGNKLRICGVNSIFDFATELPIGGLGESTSRIIVDREINGKLQSVFTIIGVEISLMKMSPNCDIFCKKIVLKSKGVIVNNTRRDLIIREQMAKNFHFLVPAGKRECSVFGLPDFKNKKRDGFTIEAQGYQKSKVFELPESGSSYFRLKKISDNQFQEHYIYHKVNVQSVEGYRFFEINAIDQKELPYQIMNKSPYLTVSIPNHNKEVKYGQSHFFIKQGPSIEVVELTLLVSHEESKEQVQVKISPDDLNFRKVVKIHVNGSNNVGELGIQIYTTFTDKTKTIVVDLQHITGSAEQKEVSYLQVLLPEIIISINQNSHKIQHPYESIVITLIRFIFIIDETDKTTKYQLKLGFLQIDQAFPHITSNPVVITPYKFQAFTRAQDPQSVFNAMIELNKSFKENTFINKIDVDFNDIVVKFSLDFLNLVTQISKQFADIMNYENKSYYINKDIEKWQKIEVPKEGRKTFIKSIRITPFYIDLSAELNLKKLGLENNQLLNTILSAIGVVVSNIEDAPIKLSGMCITNCIDTSEGITQKIISQYKGDVVNQLYKIFGSLNIIGNPMGLLRNISTGFEDFAEKPAKGFVNGPAEFGKGIVQGTGSLVAHSVGGAFNSLSKITGTVSTGLATLSFDQEFEEHRAKEKMKKPKNVLQGLQKGGKAVLYGFKQGITGLFTQPFENARRQGALGFMKGAAKGLAGLVVKPVTGVIDFASKTTEGIKNNALIFEDKANEQRMRYPRVFYTQCHILRAYEKVDSLIQYILMKPANDQKYNMCTFIDCFPADKGQQYLVVLKQQIVYVQVAKKKVLWHLRTGEYDAVNNTKNQGLTFKRRKKGGFFQTNEYEILMQSNEDRKEVIELVLRIQKQMLNNK